MTGPSGHPASLTLPSGTVLDAGIPTAITLIKTQGMTTLDKHRQVPAIGYDLTGEQPSIYVYDPNHPGARTTLPVDLGRPSRGAEAVDRRAG